MNRKVTSTDLAEELVDIIENTDLFNLAEIASAILDTKVTLTDESCGEEVFFEIEE